MEENRIIVFAGSAGSLEVILSVLPALPVDFPVPVVVVVHRGNSSDHLLSDLLSSKCKMKVKEIEDKDPILGSTIYIAPGDYHVLVENDHSFSLDMSEKVLYSRPSIDIALESVSEVYGKAALAFLLSGANADGSEGLKMIRDAGGTAVVQLPETAQTPFMPKHAFERGHYSMVLPPERFLETLKTFAISEN